MVERVIPRPGTERYKQVVAGDTKSQDRSSGAINNMVDTLRQEIKQWLIEFAVMDPEGEIILDKENLLKSTGK